MRDDQAWYVVAAGYCYAYAMIVLSTPWIVGARVLSALGDPAGAETLLRRSPAGRFVGDDWPR